jgi:two-component system sensor histidine kinase KdpD
MDIGSRYQIGAERTANAEQRAGRRECLLVVIGCGECDLDLIHAGKRLAEALGALWAVVNVQTSAFQVTPDTDHARQLEIMRTAETLGAEAVNLHGASTVRTIADYARLRRASSILLSAPTQLGWRTLRQYARMAALERLTNGIEIIAIAPRARRPEQSAPAVAHRAVTRRRWQLQSLRRSARGYCFAIAVTAICTSVGLPFSAHADLTNIVMLYMLGAAMAGMLLGRGPATLTCALNIVAFDYFFVPPIFSLEVLDTGYIVTFSVMLAVTLIIANLMIAVRERTGAAGAREQHTAALYAISRDLAISANAKDMLGTVVRHIGEVLQARAVVMLCDDSGQLAASGSPALPEHPAGVDPVVARWVIARRERAGAGTRHFTDAGARYLPMRGSHTMIGVLVVEVTPSSALWPERQSLLDAISDQLALALERTRLSDLAHAANLAAERAAMRNTLLASISHDLRTPLSAIAGAGSIVAQNDFSLDFYRRVTLGKLIEDKARDMSDLLTNVLELVRIESGPDALNRDWHAVSDLIGLAIARHESRLAGREISTQLPGDLPLLSVDSNLMVQLLSNLLENAIKYTPPGTRIHISADRFDACARLVVEDTGPGLGSDSPDQLFEKFARGRVEGNCGGVGLGLAICRAVARLHGGDISAASSALGGARFEITIPLIEEPVGFDTSSSAA